MMVLENSTGSHKYASQSRLTSVITARVRSTREGNNLTRVCLSVHIQGGGGSPIQPIGGGGTLAG